MQGNNLFNRLVTINSNVEIVKYTEIKNKIKPSTAYPELLTEENGKYYITKNGYDKFGLDSIYFKIRNPDLHPSLKIPLYAISYGNSLLIGYEKTHTKKYLKKLCDLTETTINHVNQFTLIPDVIKYNDHVVSERIEFLILFLSFLDEHKHEPELQNKIKKQIVKDVEWLLDDSHFTWRTNHGLMQIRALLNAASGLDNKELIQKCIEKAEERIVCVLPYFIADDGVILEAASGYWLYIYKQWEIISSFDCLSKSKKKMIIQLLQKSRKFLSDLIVGKGFIQGLGDSYNQYDLDYEFNNNKSYISAYSNGLINIRYCQLDKEVQILFVSLDTPPNVHKHPEDLAVYVYVNEPYFINPGTYDYQSSISREFIKSEEAQSTVSFGTNQIPDSSKFIYLNLNNDSTIINVIGRKYYDKKNITRKLTFNQVTGELKIIDSSSSILTTNYNIHPEIGLKHLNNPFKLLLVGMRDSIICNIEGKNWIHHSWIAPDHRKKREINQLIISSTMPKLTMNLPIPDNIIKHIPDLPERYRNRERISFKLNEIYPINKFSVKRFTFGRILFLCIIIASLLLLTLKQEKYKKFLYTFNLVLFIILIMDIYSSGYFLSLALFK
jgi:hypothetical protein